MRLVMRFRLPGSLRLSGISGDISARCDLGRWVTCEEEEDSAYKPQRARGQEVYLSDLQVVHRVVVLGAAHRRAEAERRNEHTSPKAAQAELDFQGTASRSRQART